MKPLLATILCMSMPFATVAADTGYKIEYDGGSVLDLQAGAKLRLYIDPKSN